PAVRTRSGSCITSTRACSSPRSPRFSESPVGCRVGRVGVGIPRREGVQRRARPRPLKRAVERYLLAPLATAIVSQTFPEGERFLFVSARQNRIEVRFVDPDADDSKPDPVAT